MATKYTYTHKFQAHYGATVVTIPDQISGNQRNHANNGNLSFPALRRDGTKVQVRLDPDAYGLFTTGTGDPVVKSA